MVIGIRSTLVDDFANKKFGYSIRWERQIRIVAKVRECAIQLSWSRSDTLRMLAMLWDVLRHVPKENVQDCDERSVQQVRKWREDGNPQALQLQAQLECGFGPLSSLWVRYGSAVNASNSIYLLIDALKNGSTEPAGQMRCILRAQPHRASPFPIGIVRKAMATMKKCSATNGDVAYHTANILFFGCPGVKANMTESFRLYNYTLEIGHTCSRWIKSRAAYNLGLMCERGEGCETRSDLRAADYYTQALNWGSRNALKNLADLYQRGLDYQFPVNYVQSRLHYSDWFGFQQHSEKGEYLTFITLERFELRASFALPVEIDEPWPGGTGGKFDDDSLSRIGGPIVADDYVYESVPTGEWYKSAVKVDVDKQDAFLAAVGTDEIRELRNFGQVMWSGRVYK
jgi:hypothetical protein